MAKSWRKLRALTLAIAAAAGLPRSVLSQPAAPQPLPGADAVPATERGERAGSINVQRLVQQYLQEEAAALNTARGQIERDDAARRLVARQSPDGRDEIVKALGIRPLPQSPAPSAPLAAARAIAEDPHPSPQFIRPLADLLGADLAHSEAAAAALVTMHDPAATDALTNFVANPAPVNVGVPLAVLRVLGTSADKTIARTLIDLLRNPRPDRGIFNGAADALVQMTHLPENGRDVAAWQRWWQANQAKPPEAFRAELLEVQRRRLSGDRMKEIDALVSRLYQLADEKGKPEMMRTFLKSNDAYFRLAGVRLVYQTFDLTGRISEESQAKLRDLIRDPSPEVRVEVARTLGGLNIQQSLETLLAQLFVEPDAAVKIAIMSAVVTLKDIRAAAELVKTLDDPSLPVAVTAAESLARLGAQIAIDRALTAQVIAGLVATLNNRAQQDPSGELRAACVEAMVPLRDPRQQPLFLNLVNQNQNPRTRIAAIAGLGALGDRNTGNAVVNWLRGEPDPLVRLAALGALRTVGTFQLDEAVFDYTRPQVEPDASNRKAAWDTFVALTPDGSQQRLKVWADRFFAAGEFERHIAVMAEILKKQLAEGPAQAQAAALTREGIAESHMKLQPPQPLKAIPYYRQALQYWLQNNGAQQVILGLTKSLLDAQIAAKEYPEAVALAGEAIQRDPRLMSDVITRFTTAADQLNKAGQFREADRLATEALKLSDRVEPRFVEWLRSAQQTARQAP